MIFGANIPKWEFVGTPLVEGNVLYLNAGGKNALVVALDKTSGQVLWKSGEDSMEAGYSSPIIFPLGTQFGVAVFGLAGLHGYSLVDGKPLWTVKWKRNDVVTTDPLVLGNNLFLAYVFGTGCSLVKVSTSAAEEIYHNASLASFRGLAYFIPIGDCLYGFSGKFESPAIVCLDPSTGDIKWKYSQDGGPVIATRNRLLFQSVSGGLVMVEASAVAYTEVGRIPLFTGQCWTTPSLAQGRVYCRNTEGAVECLDFTR